jgi:hypothetical protein
MKEDFPAVFWLQQHPSKLKPHDFRCGAGLSQRLHQFALLRQCFNAFPQSKTKKSLKNMMEGEKN